MEIIFYKYTGERNRLNKVLSDGMTVTGNFNIEYDKISAKLKLAYDNSFDFNYCYISDFEKYYFIDNVTVFRNGFIICDISEDCITTYKDLILAATGTVVQSFNSGYLQGANIPTTAKTTLKEYDFDDVFNHGGTYVMIANGYVS